MSIPDFIEWNDKLSVGIQEIDEQHKRLVELANRLNVALLSKTGDDEASEVLDVLDKLIEYTRTHFVVEESLMRILGYPDYEEHKQHHEALVLKVLAFRKRLQEDHRIGRVELMEFMRDWLVNHIMKEDILYSEHFIAHGAQRKWLKPSWFKRFWQ